MDNRIHPFVKGDIPRDSIKGLFPESDCHYCIAEAADFVFVYGVRITRKEWDLSRRQALVNKFFRSSFSRGMPIIILNYYDKMEPLTKPLR